MTAAPSLTSTLASHVAEVIREQGGWLPFDRFMALALYAPGLGYYARDDAQFGHLPRGAHGRGSDFVTAPELSPYFGRALAAQVGQALRHTGTRAIWEFGAGSGALAEQLLQALGDLVERYTIVDLSGTLRARQRERLAAFGDRVRWASAWPRSLRGVVVGNEVLDAMPVTLLARSGGVWHERGVALGALGGLVWQDRPTALRPPVEVAGAHDYLTEIHPQAEAFVRSLAERLAQGAAFFIDYGFPEREYYHPQRHMGTVMCHRAHRMDTDPLADVGEKDITAHVNFTGLALAAQEAGDVDAKEVGDVDAKEVGDLASQEVGDVVAQPGETVGPAPGGTFGVLGYTTQARFLLNCGLPDLLESASLPDRAMAQKLLMEHEMGELFKVIGFFRGAPWDAIGFAHGDRTHTL